MITGIKRRPFWIKDKVVLIFVFLFGLTVLSGCYLFWLRYHNREHKFSILLPRMWEWKEGSRQVVIVAYRPIKGKNDKYQENINVVVDNAPQDMDFEQFYELNRELTMTYLQGAKFDIEEEAIFAGGHKGKYLSFHLKSTMGFLKIQSAVWKVGGKIYTVTCTCGAEEFPKYRDIFDTSMHSIRFR